MALFFDQTQTVKRSPRIALQILHAEHQQRWVEVRQSSRDFIAPWEPLWDLNSDKPHAFRARLKNHQEEWRNKRGLSLVVVNLQQEEKPIVAGINISNIRYGVNLSASLGYWTGATFARQGYMFEALNLCIDLCFDTLKLRRLEAATLLHNQPSQRLLLKLGFQPEGISREMLCIDGQWQDHQRFALLAHDPRHR